MALAVSCSKSDNRPYFLIWGSQENGKSLIGQDGTIFTPVIGSDLVGAIPANLERVRMMIGFYPAEELPTQEQGAERIELVGYQQLRTVPYSYLGGTDVDDPILFPTIDLDESKSIFELKPGITVNMNYLDMVIFNLFYTENKESGASYAQVYPHLEIDPEIVHGQKDTVNMVLRFDSNRGAKETLKDAKLGNGTWCSFDLKNAAADFGFPLKDGADKDITYVIKMAYTSFEKIGVPDEDEITVKYLTTDWTPGNPYNAKTE